VVVLVVVLAAVKVVDAVLVLVSAYDEVLATVDVVVLVLWTTRWALCKLLSPYSCWWTSKLMMLLLCWLWCLTRSRCWARF